MVQTKTMSNLEIYNTATALVEAFNTAEQPETNFPVKVNFFLQKNMNNIIEIAREIEKSRTDIIKKYGTPSADDETQVTIPEDKIEDATKELNDLFSLEQDVSINMLKLDWFDGINMTAPQVSAITYMIEEE